jgi:GH25 family lysozyme M1 (1,4-beta-N-acetylmuramidase)
MTEMNGIDVSKYQNHINWSKVDAHGIDFALVRIGMGNTANQVDPHYRENVDQALAHGLHVGGYYFGYATSPADARREADVCNQLLQPYRGKLLFPIAYDYEYNSVDYFRRVMGRDPTNEEIDSFACAFLDRLKSYGWFVNIYTNIDFIRSGRFKNAVKKYDVWLADYSGGPDYPCYIQQTGSAGHIPGISGNVDIDVSFRDYPTMIRAGGYNGYPKSARTAVQIDTTMDLSRPHGQYYTVKTTCPQNVSLTAGTGGVVTVVPFPRTGNDQLFALVAVGRPGTEAGIYTAAPGEKPMKRFAYRIK